VIRVHVFVEGQSEQAFVSNPLAEYLWTKGVLVNPILLGGRTAYARVRGDLVRKLKEDQSAFCATMIDFYGLGKGYPGFDENSTLPGAEQVERIEDSIKAEVCAMFRALRADQRLIPYLSLHEFEALLFSDVREFAGAMDKATLVPELQKILDEYACPEAIDNGKETAPSKRVLRLHPGYSKVIDGALAAKAVGIAKMRAACPHFRSWMEKLESLPVL